MGCKSCPIFNYFLLIIFLFSQGGQGMRADPARQSGLKGLIVTTSNRSVTRVCGARGKKQIGAPFFSVYIFLPKRLTP